jgi:ankyrin repeat protein
MSGIDIELIEAAVGNNLPEVLRLLSAGADVNAKHVEGFTPLHWAGQSGHLPVVQVLLNHGAEIEAISIDGWTPLVVASLKGHVHVVIELLDRGADIEAKESNGGFTPLHLAVIQGHLTVVNELPSRGADIEARDHSSGNTPLHNAVIQGHLAIVKALLRGGANILATNNRGQLPLHLAMVAGRSEVVKYLLQRYYATRRRPPLHELLKDLTWTPNSNSTIHDLPSLCATLALRVGVLDTNYVVEVVEYLVERNLELLSSRDQDGSLPLHVACRRGAPFTIVQSLVNSYKASVKSVTPQGGLPLFLACEMPETPLDTIFLLMKFYPELVYR